MSSEALQKVAASLSRARTVDDAVRLVARVLGEAFPVDRVSVRLCVADEPTLLVVAVWSREQTQIVPGVRISKAASSFPEVLEAGGPVFGSSASVDRLLDDVIAAEGYRSWVTMPLHREGNIEGLLSVSSFTRDAFLVSDAPTFSAFARAVQARILGLAWTCREDPRG